MLALDTPDALASIKRRGFALAEDLAALTERHAELAKRHQEALADLHELRMERDRLLVRLDEVMAVRARRVNGALPTVREALRRAGSKLGPAELSAAVVISGTVDGPTDDATYQASLEIRAQVDAAARARL